MMAELGKRLETWQADETKTPFSVLFSDIGPNFYLRFGWKVYGRTHIHLASISRENYEKSQQSLPSVEDLSASDLSQIPSIQYIEQELTQLSQANPNTIYVAIRPDVEHFSWHHAREEYQAHALGKGKPTIKGAIHRPSGLALIWCRVYASNPKEWQIHILYTAIPPTCDRNSQDAQDTMAALLLRSQLEAFDWEMSAGVEVWDPSEFVIASAQKLRRQEDGKVQVITRDNHHLCSLRWAGDDEEVQWIANEKYVWC
jgi:hypothetical protein